MSSVSDQLQGNVGKSRDTAVRGDKKMCRAEEERKGDLQRRGRKGEEKRGGIIRDGVEGEMRPGWETWRGTLGDFVSCSKRESVTETVLSSCRPHSYVRAV